MSSQVEASQGRAQDGVLLNHHRDSLRPLRLHILLPHLPLDHGWPRLLRKVGSSRAKNPEKNFFVLPFRCCPCLRKKKVPSIRKQNETETWLNSTAFPDLGER